MGNETLSAPGITPPPVDLQRRLTVPRAAQGRTSGVILIDKPQDVSSHRVVGFVRHHLGKIKVGHLGTLDPFATGLLPLMVGGSTRLADELHADVKHYRFHLSLGAETDTLDKTGSIVAQLPVPELTSASLEDALEKFRGRQRQVPPKYSAIKHKGRPLYEYMRTQGDLSFDISSKSREIEIFSLKQVPSDGHPAENEAASLVLEVTCSAGTYIRSLCRDIARELGTVGHCSELRRIGVGPWNVQNALALTVDDLNAKTPHSALWQHQLLNAMIAPQACLPHLPLVDVSESAEVSSRIDSGNPVNLDPRRFNLEWDDANRPAQAFVQTHSKLFLSDLTWQSSVLLLSPRKLIDTSAK